jgi:hypothetical protein
MRDFTTIFEGDYLMNKKYHVTGELNPDEVFDKIDISSIRGGAGKPFYNPDIKTYTKKEMVKMLNDKIVRCVFIEDGNYNLFGVQDIETKKVYLLEENIK